MIGAGPIGLFTALALRHAGADHVAIADLSAERLALAERLGAGTPVNGSEVALEDWVRDEIRPEGADVALDCVGSVATARQALAVTAKGGRAVLVGLMPAEMDVDGVALQRGERTLVGVQMYLREDFGTAMRILAEGVVPAAEGVLRAVRARRRGRGLRRARRRPARGAEVVRDDVTSPWEALRLARVYDLEQPRYPGAPVFPSHEPGRQPVPAPPPRGHGPRARARARPACS